MTVDEELNVLEETVRKLKIEYDVYFGGGAKKPPNDTEWRVQNLIRKYSDSSKLSFAQRFRYNGIAQRYALFSDLWRKKIKIKEEGFRRPQDAALGIQGLRHEEEQAAAAALKSGVAGAPFKVHCSDVDADQVAVKSLFDAMMEAKKNAGQPADPNSFDSFKTFLKKKTDQIRGQYGCAAVEYSVEVQDGHVRLKAKAKT
ncbi:MAG: MXAN_5187 C-terminal domain-containing protein [Terriglobales bacterium]